MPSLSAVGVWDLPLWAWRGYARFHDDEVARVKKEASSGKR